MKNYIIRYGLLAGLVLMVLSWLNWFTIARFLGYNASEFFGYFSMFVGLMAIPLGIKYFKEQINDGKVSFGSAFQVGMGITAIASIIMFLHSAFFFFVQGDAFLTWYEASMSPEEWEVAQAQMATMGDSFMSPWFQGLVMLLTVLLMGLIISLLASLVMKKN